MYNFYPSNRMRYTPSQSHHYIHSNNQIYYSPYYYPYHYVRQFPSVNPTQFISSAKQMELIMKDASLLLQRMSSSREFSSELMSAAQESKMEKVTSMIKSTGVQTMPEISYTPDGLKLIFTSKTNNIDCCHLTLSLRWM
ncbi:hypothetical protein SM124_10060 [Bacillus sp. 31A1R]|uniref:Uncharacterized protein n=1 Tax=Robertmurraya mangrovi TaxID=3098077 RepID=A0ABU5IY80_9BACI|nr:hypothetical protein [Bacillus sp. 31A1R]MDZ5472091.1 hypothetical protein [Bacillus sp. 31A1R]